MNRLLHRVIAGALVAAFAGVSAAPCLADAATPTPARTSLTKLSPANVQVLKASTVSAARQDPSVPGQTGSFFRTRKGAVALALVAGAVGFTIWAAHDSRKPVKSPVR